MKVRTILYLLAVALFIYLLAESFLELDIAPSKNQHLTNSSKIQVDKMQDIDSVKTEAKNWIDINRQNFLQHSHKARNRMLVLITLLGLQVVLTMRRSPKET